MNHSGKYLFVCSLLCVFNIFVGLIDIAQAQSYSQDTGCDLSAGLGILIAKTYPSFRPIQLTDLAVEDRTSFRTDHPGKCPGITHIDFYGNKNETVVLSLISKSNQKDATLVIATHSIGGWTSRRLDSAPTNTAIVYGENPGAYADLETGRVVKAKHSPIVWRSYEQWAKLYAWTGSAFAMIWIAD